MKNILGLSLVVVGGGTIAYILSLKDKKVGFEDNQSLECERLTYEKDKAWGDLQEFNLKNPSPTIEQSRKIASGDQKEIKNVQEIDKKRTDLWTAWGIAESKFTRSFCALKEKNQDSNDCNRLKENIVINKEILANLEKNPEKNKENSATSGDIRYYKGLLETDQKAYDKNNCKSNTKLDVNVSDASFQKCKNIDESLRTTKNEILELQKKALTTSGLTKVDEFWLGVKKKAVNTYENQFADTNCRDKIETKRLTATAVVSTKLAEKMEEQVLGRNENEKKFYIGVGGLVLLTGLFIILKK
jgi:hypothetical protein